MEYASEISLRRRLSMSSVEIFMLRSSELFTVADVGSFINAIPINAISINSISIHAIPINAISISATINKCKYQ